MTRMVLALGMLFLALVAWPLAAPADILLIEEVRQGRLDPAAVELEHAVGKGAQPVLVVDLSKDRVDGLEAGGPGRIDHPFPRPARLHPGGGLGHPDVGRVVLQTQGQGRHPRGSGGHLQRPRQPPPDEAILTTLLNEITAVPGNIILVLDDYHLLDSAAVDHALTFLLEHLPPQITEHADYWATLGMLELLGGLTLDVFSAVGLDEEVVFTGSRVSNWGR